MGILLKKKKNTFTKKVKIIKINLSFILKYRGKVNP